MGQHLLPRPIRKEKTVKNFDYGRAEADLEDMGHPCPDEVYDYKTEKGFNTFLRENGLNPERYSHGDSGSSNNSGGCFLTTACTAARGLPDDCYELETLRGFRDNWLKKRKGGGTPIQEYYEIAPRIVEKINALPDADEIWERIYCELVVPCVELIDEGEYDAAFKHYQDYTLRLKERYLTDKASAE